MTILGLGDETVATLVRAVAEDTPDELVGEVFARASWTGIAEPGDRAAGVAIAALGAVGALTALVERWSPDRLDGVLAEAGSTELTVTELEKAIARWSPRVASPPALAALRQAARLGVRLLTPAGPHWPARIDELGPHAPIALWLRGNEATLDTLDSSIALVGARAATGYGEHVTMEASAGLVDRGYTIVSGAAYGIDGMAHRAALASSGQTVAFLAGGVDRFYPSGHEQLLTRIVESGAVLSELPCGSSPTKWRFLQRNRLIAAVSQATVVLEAGARSGSLNTAGHASTLGRPLGAVPGPVTSPASAGCHRLLRDFAAVCVTTADEMAELAPLGETAVSDDPASSLADPTSDHVRVLDALSRRSPRGVERIASLSGLSVTSVRSVLGALELEGVVAERERGWVSQPRAEA